MVPSPGSVRCVYSNVTFPGDLSKIIFPSPSVPSPCIFFSKYLSLLKWHIRTHCRYIYIVYLFIVGAPPQPSTPIKPGLHVYSNFPFFVCGPSTSGTVPGMWEATHYLLNERMNHTLALWLGCVKTLDMQTLLLITQPSEERTWFLSQLHRWGSEVQRGMVSPVLCETIRSQTLTCLTPKSLLFPSQLTPFC